jgi:hypothetical protein
MIEAASAALRGADWAGARDTFLEWLEDHRDDPEALDGLRRALWWLGQPPLDTRCLEWVSGLGAGRRPASTAKRPSAKCKDTSSRPAARRSARLVSQEAADFGELVRAIPPSV